jgi:hypothetical protein
VYVAKEAIYEMDEQGEPYRLAAAAGQEVTPEQMEAFGLSASDKRLVKMKPGDYNSWRLDNGYISESQVPNPGP